MTATDELRALLDERGVEYKSATYVLDHTGTKTEETVWQVHGVRSIYTEYPTGTKNLIIEYLEPEQAIAATLGRGTCRSTTPNDAWCFSCSECGKSFPRNELHIAHNHGEINYCPNCGAKVVDA